MRVLIVAHSVEQSKLIPEVRRSNPIIKTTFIIKLICHFRNLYEKRENMLGERKKIYLLAVLIIVVSLSQYQLQQQQLQ